MPAKLGAAIVFLGCLGALIANRAAHLHFTTGADVALIVGAVLGALDLL